MRRPLATAGLFFVAIIFIIQLLIPGKSLDYSPLDGLTSSISGQVIRIEHRTKENKYSSVIYLNNISIDSSHHNAYGQTDSFPNIPKKAEIICYLKENEAIPDLGSYVYITGKLHTFEEATNQGMFNAKTYYEITGIVLSMSNCEINSAVETSTLLWRIKNKLHKVKQVIAKLCDLCFTDKDSSIIKTMLLGEKANLSPDIKSLYSQSGIAHILAISGLHISLLGLSLHTLLKKLHLPSWICLSLPVVLMVMYGLMTGTSPSSIRAIIMFSLRMMANICNRTYDTFTSLVFSAVLILLEQPKYIFYSGFQFSFGALLAIIMILPILEDIIPKALAGGIAITVITLPISLYNYYYYPLLGIVINLIVLPLMTFLLSSAIVIIAICALFVPLGQILAFIPHIILMLYEGLCFLSEALPINKLVYGKPSSVQIVIYFILIAVCVSLKNHITKLQTILLLCLSGIVLTISVHFGTEITLLDVGQGDCIYVSTASQNILIDGGSSTVSEVGKYRIEPFLLSKGVSQLDAIFISHLDADHYNGILELIIDAGKTAPKIRNIYVSSSVYESSSDEYIELCKLADSAHIPISVMNSGNALKLANDQQLICLYPNSNSTSDSSNAESLTLLLDLGKVNVLFTGDLEDSGEVATTEILNKLKETSVYISQGDINILKVAHHGSKNSTSEAFLSTYKPDIALISAGKNNSYGHPHKETLERCKKCVPNSILLRTDESGQVTVKVDRGEIQINRFTEAN